MERSLAAAEGSVAEFGKAAEPEGSLAANAVAAAGGIEQVTESTVVGIVVMTALYAVLTAVQVDSGEVVLETLIAGAGWLADDFVEIKLVERIVAEEVAYYSRMQLLLQ